MTLQQFETALHQTTRQVVWYATGTDIWGYLAAERSACCPLTAVAYVQTGVLWDLHEAELAAAELGLPETTCTAIISAANGFLTPEATALRARLRACVGLPTEGAPACP